MNQAEYATLHIIHVFAVLGLVASVFYACAADPTTRKRTLMWGGIASLVVAATGMRLAMGIYHAMPAWVWVKVVCWLAISAFSGVAYRRREKAPLWVWLTLGLSAVALVMVYAKPF